MPKRDRSAHKSQPVVVTHRLHTTVERVWQVMATPGALPRYHPFCSDNPFGDWPGVGAEDTIRYESGLVLHRRFTAWDEGHAYELEIGNVEWPTSHVRWEVKSVDAQKSELTITVWPNAFADYPAPLRWAVHRWYLIPLLRRYLRTVLRGLDYHLTTGHDVTPNQFGRVPFFSPADEQYKQL